MGQKLKNLLIPKKPILLGLLFFFVVLGISIPARQVSAGWWVILTPVGTAIASFLGTLAGEALQAVLIIVAGFVAISLIGQLFLSLAIGLLELVTSPTFITLSYTNPEKNPILKIGWGLTRDLANVGFVIVLVIIGLATALRIKEYQWQKTLPVLIGVILLINFTPVIIGLVVDASNILMNEFLKEVKEWGNFIRVFEKDSEFTNIFKVTRNLFELRNIGKTLVFWVYAYTTAAILFVYSVLFMLRYVAIWILVILSPLAFLAYILPKTRKYFSQWWHQLLHWSFIGVIAAFFLYLSNIILTEVVEGRISLGGEMPSGIEGAGIANRLLPYFVVVVFLYLAFFVGLKTSAYGATTVVKWAQIRGKKAAKGATRFTAGAIRGIPAVRKAEEKIRERLEALPVIGRAVGGPGSYERQKRKKMKKLGEDFEGLPPEKIRRAMRVRPFTYEDKLRQARLFEILTEKGELSDDDKKYLGMADKMGLDMNKVLERRPDWAPDRTIGKTIPEAIAAVDPETFRKNVQKEALKNPEVAFHFMMDESKFREMEEKGKAELKRTIKETLLQQNISVYMYPPGQQPFVRRRFNRINYHARWQV